MHASGATFWKDEGGVARSPPPIAGENWAGESEAKS